MAATEHTKKKKTPEVVEGDVVNEKPAAAARPANKQVYQFPNKPILIAIFAFLVSGPLPGFLGWLAYVVGICALGYWSYLEVEHGVNGSRRFLGWLGALLTLNLFIHLLFG